MNGARGWLVMLGLVGFLGWGAQQVEAQIDASPTPGSGDAYQIIGDQAQADNLFMTVRQALKADWNISVERSVELKLVEPSVMDDLTNGSPYKGAEIGLYVPGQIHHIYVMKDWSRDKCGGVMAHEFTHAWQNEHCPAGQERAIKEGFAVWIANKYLDKIGAYQEAQHQLQYEDPVYGVGIKTMLAWEDKVGANALVNLVQHVRTLSDGPH